MTVDPNEGRTNPGGHGDAYSVREEAAPAPRPAAPAGDPGRPGPLWQVARVGGQREGPLTTAALVERITAGTLAPNDLVWHEGMPAWAPVREVPELWGNRPKSPPLALPVTPDDDWKHWGMVPPWVDAILSRPEFFRVGGRACAGLGVLTLVVGMISLNMGWIQVTISLAMAFFVGEAVGATLAKLNRIESRLPKEEAKKETPLR